MAKKYGLIWYHCTMTTQLNNNYYRFLKKATEKMYALYRLKKGG